ncbi:NAD-dependent epimerase/dehydratase family protein [Streptomyces sp. NPDC058662]|uniref:NAD-dependent epimerase/dehydratase family protein n=1 Tax=Streptomyces sp. NPDC058662 TaxID=3346583 RepID=UPI00364EE5B2
MRILVTGGAGFTGSHFVRSLLVSEAERETVPTAVTVPDALTYAGNRANPAPVAADPRLRFLRGSTRAPAPTPPSLE